MTELAQFFTWFYLAIVHAFATHWLAVGLTVLLAAALVVGAYYRGRSNQAAADRAAMGDSYRAGYNDRHTMAVARRDNVYGVISGRPVTAPTDWRDVPAALKARDAEQAWRAEQGLGTRF